MKSMSCIFCLFSLLVLSATAAAGQTREHLEDYFTFIAKSIGQNSGESP